MSEKLFSNKASDITAEASAWVAQIETGELSPADLDAFREWMQRSPRHAAEAKRLAKVSGELNVLTDMAEPLKEAISQYRTITKGRAGWSMFSTPGIAIIGMIFVTISLVFFLRLQTGAISDEPLLVTTSVGDYREIELSDGTLVKLNTDSQIEVDYDNNTRRVRLLAGEAFFDVTPNADRPFFVYAGENYVRVIGTAFVIRLIEKDFEVTVTKGRVELAETTTIASDSKQVSLSDQQTINNALSTHKSSIILEVGQSVSISALQEISPVITMSERDLKRELSWQKGLHDFSNTPLEEVVKELGRYTDLEIEIVDQSLRKLEFGGIFRTGETQPLFDALQSAFGINVEYINDNKVRLSLADKI